MQPHLNDPWGTKASYQHPYICRGTTIGCCLSGGNRGCGCAEWSHTGLFNFGSVKMFFYNAKQKVRQSGFFLITVSFSVSPVTLIYLYWRLEKVMLDKRSFQKPSLISGSIFWSVCLCCESWPQKSRWQKEHHFWATRWTVWWIFVYNKQAVVIAW